VSEFAAYRDFLKGVSDNAGQMLQLVGAGTTAATSTAKADNSDARDLLVQAFQQMRGNNQKKARELLDRAKTLNDQQSGLWVEYGMLDWYSNNKTQALAD
jgi:hypothetical protein